MAAWREPIDGMSPALQPLPLGAIRPARTYRPQSKEAWRLMTTTGGRPKIGVIVHQPLRDQLFTADDQRRLNALGRVTWTESRRPLSMEDAIEILRDCDVGVGSWASPHPGPALMAGCPKLALWEHVAGSVKHMFGSHLEGRVSSPRT